MTSMHQDLCLWTCLGVFGFFAARAVHKQLHAIRTISEVTHISPKEDLITQRRKNELKLGSLSQLAQSPSFEIRAASIRIIADLALEQAPLQFLLRDIRGKDEERRNRALTCLCFLTTDSQQLAKVQPVISEACTAIISCLCNLLPEAIEAETMLLNTNFAVRSEHFLNAIYFLKRILRSGFVELTKAGLITKWLSQYPFGGNMSKEGRKQRIKHLLSEDYEDIVMRSLVLIAESQPLSRSQLEDYGLLDKRDETLTNHPTDSMQMFDYPIEIIYESGTSDSRPSSADGRRLREESLEEVALRRRRREAMVLGENGVPLVRANIIEPNSGAHQEGIMRSHL